MHALGHCKTTQYYLLASDEATNHAVTAHTTQKIMNKFATIYACVNLISSPISTI